MKTSSSRRHARGFTLMELLVVISIIVILAGLTIGGMNFVSQKQAREKAKIQIQLLQSALEDYRSDTGEYPMNPRPDGKNGTTRFYRELFPSRASDKIYLTELDPESDTQGWLNGQSGSNLKVYDPWGNEYYYRTNNPSQPDRTIAANPDFDLWSAGPDGKTVAGTDGDYDPQAPDNLDDIRGW